MTQHCIFAIQIGALLFATAVSALQPTTPSSNLVADQLRLIQDIEYSNTNEGAGHGGKEFQTEASRKIIRDFLKTIL